ncbi:MAG: BlaI/MecI/CopY family transcriptional regulator [bacterium]|nr:BlaI/MecI/CopY family transcriptional regulator [bacterium]
MTDKMLSQLSRRERQIMEVVYMLGRASAADILTHMPEDVSDASLRKLVRVLETKGHLEHVRRGREHIYLPTIPRRRIQRQAADDLLRTLFQGSLSAAVSALLDAKAGELDDEEAARLRRLIDEAEAEGR